MFESYELFMDHISNLNFQVMMDAPEWMPSGSMITMDHGGEFDEVGSVAFSQFQR